MSKTRRYLVAQDRDGETVRCQMLEMGTMVVGRGEGAEFDVPDAMVSRKHAEVWLIGAQLAVKSLPEASNPVFFHGHPQAIIFVNSGDFFVIGTTRFQFTDQEPDLIPATITHEHAIPHQIHLSDAFAV